MISWKTGAALGPREKSCWVRRRGSALQNRIMPKLRHNLVSFKIMLGTSPVLQWLRLHLPMQGLQIQSLVREQRSHTPWDQKTKHQAEAIL